MVLKQSYIMKQLPMFLTGFLRSLEKDYDVDEIYFETTEKGFKIKFKRETMDCGYKQGGDYLCEWEVVAKRIGEPEWRPYGKVPFEPLADKVEPKEE